MPDFGARLRDARERRGIPLRQISERTKISIAALEALERSDASRLPGGIFARSFVRSYATEVGLDADSILEDFLQRFSGDPRFSVMSASPDDPGDAGRSRSGGLLVTLVVVGLVAGGLILYFTLVRQPAIEPASPQSDAVRRTTTTRGLAALPVRSLRRLPGVRS